MDAMTQTAAALEAGFWKLDRPIAGAGPQGRAVCFERSYLGEGEQGAEIRVEGAVYEPKSFEEGVRLIRSIRR